MALGSTAAAFVFSGAAGFARKRDSVLIPEAIAQTAGSWTSGSNTSTVAIHGSILRTGRIFYFAGSVYHSSNQDGPFAARLLNFSDGSESNVSMQEDLFCAGQAPLPSGNILLAGGTLLYDIADDNCNGKW